MLDEAIRLAEDGFSVIWLKPRSKKPFENDWTQLPTKTVAKLESSYRDGYNMGVRLGEPSKIGDFYLLVADMDIRDKNHAKEAQRQIFSLFELNIDDFPTVISGSGGESRHFYMLSEVPIRSKVLWHSKDKFTGEDGKEHWCAEIELFGTGKQVALPPSFHPITGKRYRWAEEFDKNDLPIIDKDLLAAITGEDYEQEEIEPLSMDEQEVADVIWKLTHMAESHDTWRDVGMAVHHELGPKGFRVFDEWSRGDGKKPHKGYDKANNRAQYRAFKNQRHGKVITMRSMVALANEIDRHIDEGDLLDMLDTPDDDEDVGPRPLTKAEQIAMFEADAEANEPSTAKAKIDGVPKHLLTVPGMLGMAVDHYNATAKQDQPQFAVQTALALGSVVCGRYYKTDIDNYTSMYFVVLGRTGAGKEFTRSFLGKMLSSVGAICLMGPSGFKSEAAVVAELQSNPRNVTVVDEFGRVLGSNKKSTNANQTEAQTLLMSLFGIQDGEFRPQRYSANGKTVKQVSAEATAKIVRPALTLVGMSTPETFYDALSQDNVADGFMNRLVIVNTRMPLGLPNMVGWKEPPKKLTKWLASLAIPKSIRTAMFDEDEPGEGETTDKDAASGTNGLGESAGSAPDPEVVYFSKAARKRLFEIAVWIKNTREALTPTKVDGLWARAHELTHRLALIVALSCDHDYVEASDIDWAWDYIKFYTEETVQAAMELMGSSPVVRTASHVAELIAAAGNKGMTMFELGRKSQEFKNMGTGDLSAVVYRLEGFHDIHPYVVKSSKGGPSTTRYIHADFAPRKKTRDHDV